LTEGESPVRGLLEARIAQSGRSREGVWDGSPRRTAAPNAS